MGTVRIYLVGVLPERFIPHSLGLFLQKKKVIMIQCHYGRTAEQISVAALQHSTVVPLHHWMSAAVQS